ncbi:MAG: 4-hydroxy-3-methylbut-2-enyl diphosphate reductase [Alphaproteobacteria bacterium]|nr:4-hydroxy-3-methylbut-2-enyl diphosphate reductase [Alphaproteobacteria bacterium]MBV9370796.1 4-hydroxy-3-methylbut-2-enyl diphosphate reductase [Alphaproteobacteria bacterium]MBV9900124.1 4-hydroxy-3-methylbut-2-enyl diphosphate reductase [Alphaproteobacteria bacterium]
MPLLHILLASPRGFCAGVRRAIDAVRSALRVHGAPVYVRRPIVHNLAVVRALEAEGAVFVEELDEVPEGGVVILSAHGVAPAIAHEARRRRLVAYDAVCPLVAKVHREVERHHRSGRHVVLVGHAGHPEIVGTLGHLPEGAATLIRGAGDVAALPFAADAPLGLAVQTTYSVDEAAAVAAALAGRFSDVAQPSSADICYATTNRQEAVRAIALRADAVIVAGEHFSSNACRLAEVAAAAGCRHVQLVADPSGIDWELVPAGGTLGIGAAASTPESAVGAILAALGERHVIRLETVRSAVETTEFRRVAVG